MDKARIAVIGLGWIGFRHAQLALESQEIELVAVCDALEIAEKQAVKLGKPFYRNHNEMMDKEAIDGVVVATPTRLHVPIGVACAERGLHILVEKPISDSMEDSNTLVKAAANNHVQLLVGHYRRFHRPVVAAREIVKSGRIGRFIGVSGMWSVLKEPQYFEPEWRRKPGAGPILTNMIHDVDCLRYICGEIAGIQSITSNKIRRHEIEDTAGVLIHFENGGIGTFLLSDTAPSPWNFEAATGDNPDLYKTGKNCYHFFGSEGSFSFPDLNIWCYPDSEHSGWKNPIKICETALSSTDEPKEPLALQLDHFGRVIAGKEKPRCSGLDGMTTLSVIQSIFQAGLSGAKVTPSIP